MTVARFIYKYPLSLREAKTLVKMPRDAVVRHVGMQNGDVTIWAEVLPDNPTVTRTFHVFGTGHPITTEPGSTDFVGTVFDGPFVWHVFDAGERIWPPRPEAD